MKKIKITRIEAIKSLYCAHTCNCPSRGTKITKVKGIRKIKTNVEDQLRDCRIEKTVPFYKSLKIILHHLAWK